MENMLTADQAAANLDSFVQYGMGAGLYKTFQELDTARMSVQILRNEISQLKTLHDGNQKRIGELETEIAALKGKK